jgi:hypothetical protein
MHEGVVVEAVPQAAHDLDVFRQSPVGRRVSGLAELRAARSVPPSATTSAPCNGYANCWSNPTNHSKGSRHDARQGEHDACFVDAGAARSGALGSGRPGAAHGASAMRRCSGVDGWAPIRCCMPSGLASPADSAIVQPSSGAGPTEARARSSSPGAGARPAPTGPLSGPSGPERLLPAGRVYAVTCGQRKIVSLHTPIISGGCGLPAAGPPARSRCMAGAPGRADTKCLAYHRCGLGRRGRRGRTRLWSAPFGMRHSGGPWPLAMCAARARPLPVGTLPGRSCSPRRGRRPAARPDSRVPQVWSSMPGRSARSGCWSRTRSRTSSAVTSIST